jgi:hypothetical protein
VLSKTKQHLKVQEEMRRLEKKNQKETQQHQKETQQHQKEALVRLEQTTQKVKKVPAPLEEAKL